MGCKLHCIIKSNVFDLSLRVQTPMTPQPPVTGFRESIIALTFTPFSRLPYAKLLCSLYQKRILLLVQIGPFLRKLERRIGRS